MKKIIIALTILMAFLISCQKDVESSSENEDTIVNNSTIITNGEDKDNSFRYLDVTLRSGEFNFPIFFKSSVSSDNQNIYSQIRKQVSYNKNLIDSVKLVRFGSSETTVQYSVPNGIGGVIQPIIKIAVYDVYIKYKNTNIYENIGRHISELSGSTIIYKPNNESLLYINNSQKITTITRPTNTSQTFYSWFYGTTKVRFLYNITNSAGTSTDQFLDPTTGGAAFILNHKM